MTVTTNFDRIAWAAEALSVFRRRTGTDYDDALCDLLCNLMHWAGEHNFEFDAVLDRGRSLYLAEIEEAEDADSY